MGSKCSYSSSINCDPMDKPPKKLSLFFATLCVIDLFGVFPIVALPKAIILCGMYGICVVCFVVTFQIYTAVILGRCWLIAEKLQPEIIKKSRYPYAAIAELTYGKYMSLFVTILLDITVFGGGIPNLLMASQNLQLFGERISQNQFHFSFCWWLIIIGIFLCPLMWLGSPKNMKELAIVSVITTTSVAVLTWTCIITDWNAEKMPPPKDSTPSFTNLLKAYGIIAFQFDIHPMLLTIEVDMKEKQKIGKAVSCGILVTVSLSAVTTLIAYCRYGLSTPANVLEIIPGSSPLYITILLVTIQLCISNAIGTSALFQHLEDVFSVSRDLSVKRCLIRSCLVCLAVVIGEAMPHFDILMGLIGGCFTGPLIFILPPLFYSKIVKMESEHERRIFEELSSSNQFDDVVCRYGTISYEKFTLETPSFWTKVLKFCKLLYSDCVLAGIVIVFGLMATFASTYYNLLAMPEFVLDSSCLNNLTKALPIDL